MKDELDLPCLLMLLEKLCLVEFDLVNILACLPLPFHQRSWRAATEFESCG